METTKQQDDIQNLFSSDGLAYFQRHGITPKGDAIVLKGSLLPLDT